MVQDPYRYIVHDIIQTFMCILHTFTYQDNKDSLNIPGMVQSMKSSLVYNIKLITVEIRQSISRQILSSRSFPNFFLLPIHKTGQRTSQEFMTHLLPLLSSDGGTEKN